MSEIKVTFADGTTVLFHEDQSFQTIIKTESGTAKSQIFTLWSHISDDLIPSFTEMLTHGLFFFDIENPSVIYSTSSVVKIEQL